MAINTEDNRNGQEILLVRRVSCLYDETRWIKFSDELRLSSLHKTMQRWYTIYSLCPLLEDFVQVLVIILRAFRLLLRYRAHSYKKKNSEEEVFSFMALRTHGGDFCRCIAKSRICNRIRFSAKLCFLPNHHFMITAKWLDNCRSTWCGCLC